MITNLDMDNVLADMLVAMKSTVGNNWDEVKQIAGQFLEREKERLKLLTELRLSGDITQEKFDSRMNDINLVIEAELQATAVLSKAMAQRTANAATDILEKAVKTALEII